MLDNPVSGRVFFEQVIRDNLDIGRPDQVGLIFDRRLIRHGPHHPGPVPHPGHHRRRHPEPARRLQEHHDQAIPQVRESALRTETTINDTRDFEIGKRLTNLPALREIGFPANRRLLRVQRLDHDPITGTTSCTRHRPGTHPSGTRVPGLRLGQQRSHALLAALLMFRLQPNGFTNHDLRAPDRRAPRPPPEAVTVGQMTYDLRRLRLHGLITRIPHTHRYRVTDTGLHSAMLLTRVHDRLLPTGLAELTEPAASTARHAALRAADRLPGRHRRPHPTTASPPDPNSDPSTQT